MNLGPDIQNYPSSPFPFSQQPFVSSTTAVTTFPTPSSPCYINNNKSTINSSASSRPNYQSHHHPQARFLRSRFYSIFPCKRSTRAPRMRWTSTLYARFVHAVELFGGRERATPKSVLEFMDVKDLTLAHVKSHLQDEKQRKVFVSSQFL
nr:probable transcription factor KAN2 [Nicotiana tomentosiformis]